MDKIQEQLMEIMKYTHKVCVDNDIKYGMYGGTLLGAVRHSGYIPWDDDIDLLLEQEAIEKLANIINADPLGKYKVLMPFDKDYPYFMAKIVDTSTTMLEEYFKYNPKFAIGVWVDLFAIMGLSDNDEECEQLFLEKELLYEHRYLTFNKDYAKGLKGKIKYCLFKSFPNSYYKKNNQKHCTRYPSITAERAGAINTSLVSKIMQKKWLNEVTLMDFEGEQFYGSVYYDEILKVAYGDYMTLPDEKNRVTDHHIDYCNYDLPYAEYKKQQKKR